jgi:L-ascorbate metabolism protein UlaG (beta-lactamase superfamily)
MAKLIWAGQSCFQLSVSNGKDHSADIVIDPFDEKIGLKTPNFSADILLASHGHHDHNNMTAIKGKPFVIETPGEYEVKGVFVQGIDSFHDDVLGKERGKNTIFVIEAEDMRFCHLGNFGQKQLTDEQLETIGKVDILMIPVGGNYTISSSEASKIIGQIEPKIVIPMHYALPKLKIELDGVDKFLKAMGKNSVTPVDKLTVKASTLPKEGAMEIVVLTP